MTLDSRWIGTIVTLILLNMVYLPLLMYYLMKYLKFRNQIVIKKRYPEIAIIMAYLALIYITISRWLALIPITMIDTNQLCFYDDCRIAKFVFYWISLIPYCICVIGTPMFLLLKYYLVYFEIQWMQQCFNFHWKNLINPKYTSNGRFRFYVKHHYRLRNRRLMIGLCFVLSSILIAISMILWILCRNIYKIGNYAALYDLFVVTMIVVMIFISYIKTPDFMDNFFITDELRALTILLFFGLMSYSSLYLIPYVLYITFGFIWTPAWTTIYSSNINAFFYLGAGLIQSQFVFNKCKSILQRR